MRRRQHPQEPGHHFPPPEAPVLAPIVAAAGPAADRRRRQQQAVLGPMLHFYIGDEYIFFKPRSAWFDDREMTLWYRDYKALFTHGTSGRSPEPSPEADCPQCDSRLQLLPTPSNCDWHILGGYRPSLLSPLTLAQPPSSWDGEEERQEFEDAMSLLTRRKAATPLLGQNCFPSSALTVARPRCKRRASFGPHPRSSSSHFLFITRDGSRTRGRR